VTDSASYSHFCHICRKPVNLKLAIADEQGRTVHGGCYFLKLVAQRPIAPGPTQANVGRPANRYPPMDITR
jgi:hypothetical protein